MLYLYNNKQQKLKAMKTINKNTKLTNAEADYLADHFNKNNKLCRKITLFGAGHPQLPDLFWINLNEDDEVEFWQEHETTHARFIIYKSLDDMGQDVNLWRDSLVTAGEEIMLLPVYQ